jgi:hypothetical protein
MLVGTVELGSLFVGRQAQQVPQNPIAKTGDIPIYSGGQITIRNTVPGKAITWVAAGDILIADRCLLSDVTWKELDAAGLIAGREVCIDGHKYLCRAPKVGYDSDRQNEWDKALAIMGADNSLWHWKSMYFWGADGLTTVTRIARGCITAYTRDFADEDSRYFNVGFRPCLIPLEDDFASYLVGGEAQ